MSDQFFTDDQIRIIADGLIYVVRPFLGVWIFSIIGSLSIRWLEYQEYKKTMREEKYNALMMNKNG